MAEPAALEVVVRSGPPVGVSAGPLGLVQAADREIGRQTAARIRAVVAFAATRPASGDRPAGTPGAMSAAARAARPLVLEPVSEWAAQEVSVALSVTQYRAVELLEQSLLVASRLAASLTALEAGTIHPGHLAVLRAHVAPVPDPGVRAAVEADLLRWIAGTVRTPAQLADRARRVVLRLDATAAARRLATALAGRGVYLSPGREPGMEHLTAVLGTPEARACLKVLGAYVDALDDADAGTGAAADGEGAPVRTRDQKMADVLLDLILRPGQTGLPVVQAQLTLVATVETMAGGEAPGEIDGQVVPAAMIRHLAQRLGLLPEPAPDQQDVVDHAGVHGQPQGGDAYTPPPTDADAGAGTAAGAERLVGAAAGPSTADPVVPGRASGGRARPTGAAATAPTPSSTTPSSTTSMAPGDVSADTPEAPAAARAGAPSAAPNHPGTQTDGWPPDGWPPDDWPCNDCPPR